jgi:hypothetical protein
MVKRAEPVTGVTRSAVAGSRTITDLADSDAVALAHADGATLVLQSLHRMWPPLVRFCRDLAADLGHNVQCNAYITPGGNAQGFAYHHDTHDVFVLQVAGRKRWQIHQPVQPLPTRRQSRSGADLVPDGQEPLLDVELTPGDALYLPRGYVHAAQTTDERSVHLTIGILATTWYDVLRRVVTTAAADELTFRHALPLSPGDALEADPGQVSAVVQQAAQWLAGLPEERLAELVRAELSGSRPEPLRMLAQAEAAASADAGTQVRPRRGVTAEIETTDDGRIAVVLSDRRIELPAFTEPAMRALLSGPATAREIASGELDAAGAIVLVRRLLREGALVAVP